MAKQGRLVLFRTRSTEQAREHIELYMNTMLAAGFNEQEVETNVGQCWMWRDAYASETDTQAREEFMGSFEIVDHRLAQDDSNRITRWRRLQADAGDLSVQHLVFHTCLSLVFHTSNRVLLPSPPVVSEQK